LKNTHELKSKDSEFEVEIVETEDIDQTAFKNMMTGAGYEVKTKQLRLRADGSAKGDWDMGIAIDAIAVGTKVDTICLVSGDGDFEALVEHLKASGVRVEVYSFRGSTADDLINRIAHGPPPRSHPRWR